MSASFHPADDLLVAYGAGSLDEAGALLVATHLALCPECRADLDGIETLGGVILDDMPPDQMGADALATVMARLDDRPLPLKSRVTKRRSGTGNGLPSPLREYVGEGLNTLKWTRVATGVEQTTLASGRGTRARLLRVGAGIAVPEHGHGGTELTLVLQGGFKDAGRSYGRGDVATADESVVHSPAADGGETCLCLAVTDAPLKLTGLVGFLVNPFLRV